MSNVVSNSFVVLSDFHAMDWPVEKISDYYLNEYDKIYILGDACDRGDDGNGKNSFNVLKKIYELSKKYPGRVVYIPGNHDQMLYHAVNGDGTALNNLLHNGGRGTYETYKNRYKGNSDISADMIERLVKWIGEQPIQAVHYYNGQKYVLAHAFFNQRFYDENPNFCFKDCINMLIDFDNGRVSEGYVRRALADVNDILWFRKANSTYNSKDLPKDNSIMVIGHTPERSRQDVNLDLVNDNGDIVHVYCVDGGIVFDSNMLKFDGGKGVIKTRKYGHNDTSPKQSKSSHDTTSPNKNIYEGLDDKYFDYVFGENGIKLLNDVIISTLRSQELAPKETYNNLNKFMTSLDVSFLPDIPGLRDKANEISPYISCIVFQSLTKGNTNVFTQDMLKDYVDEVALDYIISSTMQRFGGTDSAEFALSGLFREENFAYITESVGNARTVAFGVGINNLKNVIKRSECNGIKGYVEKKFSSGASQK